MCVCGENGSTKSKTNGRRNQRKTIETTNDFYVTSLFMFILCVRARVLCAELQFDRIIMMHRMHINLNWKSMSHIVRIDTVCTSGAKSSPEAERRRAVRADDGKCIQNRFRYSSCQCVCVCAYRTSETLECAQIVFYCHKSVGDCCLFCVCFVFRNYYLLLGNHWHCIDINCCNRLGGGICLCSCVESDGIKSSY